MVKLFNFSNGFFDVFVYFDNFKVPVQSKVLQCSNLIDVLLIKDYERLKRVKRLPGRDQLILSDIRLRL